MHFGAETECESVDTRFSSNSAASFQQPNLHCHFATAYMAHSSQPNSAPSVGPTDDFCFDAVPHDARQLQDLLDLLGTYNGGQNDNDTATSSETLAPLNQGLWSTLAHQENSSAPSSIQPTPEPATPSGGACEGLWANPTLGDVAAFSAAGVDNLAPLGVASLRGGGGVERGEGVSQRVEQKTAERRSKLEEMMERVRAERDARRQRRIMSNRASAKRSRERQQLCIKELTQQVERLQEENASLRRTAEDALSNLARVGSEYNRLRTHLLSLERKGLAADISNGLADVKCPPRSEPNNFTTTKWYAEPNSFAATKLYGNGNLGLAAAAPPRELKRAAPEGGHDISERAGFPTPSVSDRSSLLTRSTLLDPPPPSQRTSGGLADVVSRAGVPGVDPMTLGGANRCRGDLLSEATASLPWAALGGQGRGAELAAEDGCTSGLGGPQRSAVYDAIAARLGGVAAGWG